MESEILSISRIDIPALKRELVRTSLVNDVTRIMLSASTLQRALNSLFLGIGEITGLRRMAFFGTDASQFSLVFVHGSGLRRRHLNGWNLPLGHGPWAESAFLDKHILVEEADVLDPFRHHLGSRRYALVPAVSRAISRGTTGSETPNRRCPGCQGSRERCWARPLDAQGLSEEALDARRDACVRCPFFKCEGVFWLDLSPPSPPLTGEGMGCVLSLVQQAGVMLESFRINAELEKANQNLHQVNRRLASVNRALSRAQERIETDLDRARGIQKSLLPSTFPDHLLQDKASRYVPAGKVGGDYYDCFEVAPGQLGLVVADVSGHGIAAALIMSMFKVLLKTFSPSQASPAEILDLINRAFLREMQGPYFVTAFYGIFDIAKRELRYCNAGHTPQLLLEGPGEPRELASKGLFLGIMEDARLREERIALPQRTRLTLFTDGLVEAHSEKQEMFGLSRVKQWAAATASLPAETALEKLMEAFDAHRLEGDLADDLTLVILDL